MDSARMGRSTVAASGPSCGAGKVKVAAGPWVLVPLAAPTPPNTIMSSASLWAPVPPGRPDFSQ